MKNNTEDLRTMVGIDYCTVGDLRRKMEGLSDDTPVFYQRIEDVYFKKHGWKVLELPWDSDSTAEYIRAWCAFTTKIGKKTIFCLDGHY